MPHQNLYFIAILPPEAISEEITAFKHDFAAHYESSRALKNMPHITLKAPFKLNAVQHGELLEWFGNLNIKIDPFTVELEDFGSFNNRNNPVIYVKPVMSPALQQLQKAILDQFERAYPEISVPYTERKFNPHMTVAYRDLTPEQYARAIDVYQHKKYHAVFKVEHFVLLQHDGTQWNVAGIKGL